jgi:hypothetical protein
MTGATRKISNVQLLDSVSINHGAGLLSDSINDTRLRDYHRSLDKKGKAHFALVSAIVSSHSRMNTIERDGDVVKLYSEAQRSVEADRATLISLPMRGTQ